MTTSSTSLLGLALPVTGELNGTWGDVVNNSLTSLLDTAIAGTTTLSADLDVTLTTTALTANQARQAVLLCTGNRTGIKTITAPAQSKTYVVINATTGSPAYAVKIVGAGPTTGVTIPNGKACLVAWNGSDFVVLNSAVVNLATDVTGLLPGANGGTGVNNTGKTITLGGNLTTSGAFDTTLTTSAVTNVTLPTTGTLATRAGSETLTNKTINGPDNTLTNIANASLANSAITINGNSVSLGGSTTVTAAAPNALTIGTGLSGGSYNGSTAVTIALATGYGDTLNPYASKTANFVLAAPDGSAGAPTFRAIVAADIPTLNQNTTGTAAGLSATLAVGSGGTGQTTYTDGQLLIGNSSGNTLTKATLTAGTGVTITNGNGSITISSTGGTVTSVGATAPVASSGGATPTISLSAGYGDTQNPYASKTANNFLAAPNGSAGAPTFRSIVAADIPTLNQNTTGSAGSATNISGGAANRIPYNTGAGATTFIAAPTVTTTFLSWNGSSFVWSTVTPATGNVFTSDISVNSLTVGRGNSGQLTATTVGYQASAAATSTAVQQTAIGYRALATATTTAGVGFDYEGSTAIGYKALENSAPSILSYNTAVGAGALKALTTGGLNTAVGAGAARSLVGLQTVSTAIGALAGEYSTTGGFTAVGARALNNSTTASYGSVAVGVDALRYATTNSGNSSIYNQNNTAIGHTALSFLDADTSGLSGNNNTALGYQAGYDLESGSNNTILGYDAQASSINVSNEITLGNSAVTTLRCQVTSITSLSDQRDKYDIEDLPVGLNLINALRPRRYKWDKRDWYIDEVQTTQEDGTVIREKVAVPKDGSRAQTDWNEGFVAQEAKAALQSLGVDWFPLVYDVNPEKLEMSSGKLIPVLVKAIQELTARIEALEAK